MKRRDLTRDRVDLLRNPKLRRSAPDVVRAVRTALPFGKSLNSGHPTIASHPRRVVDRYAGVVANLRAGDALRLIFVKDRLPLTGKIHLGKSRSTDAQHHQKKEGHDYRGSLNPKHLLPPALVPEFSTKVKPPELVL